MPISTKVKSNIKEIVSQWDNCDFDCVGFSYKPVTPEFLEELLGNNSAEPKSAISKKVTPSKGTLDDFKPIDKTKA